MAWKPSQEGLLCLSHRHSCLSGRHLKSTTPDWKAVVPTHMQLHVHLCDYAPGIMMLPYLPFKAFPPVCITLRLSCLYCSYNLCILSTCLNLFIMNSLLCLPSVFAYLPIQTPFDVFRLVVLTGFLSKVPPLHICSSWYGILLRRNLWI